MWLNDLIYFIGIGAIGAGIVLFIEFLYHFIRDRLYAGKIIIK